MWIFTTQGFCSTVEHRCAPDLLIIRCRAGDDIDALRRQIPALEPFEDPSADYRLRTGVRREEWIAALDRLDAEIDYPHFKNAIAAEQGHERARRSADVWSEMPRLQER